MDSRISGELIRVVAIAGNCNFVGWLPGGKKFDANSVTRSAAFPFAAFYPDDLNRAAADRGTEIQNYAHRLKNDGREEVTTLAVGGTKNRSLKIEKKKRKNEKKIAAIFFHDSPLDSTAARNFDRKRNKLQPVSPLKKRRKHRSFRMQLHYISDEFAWQKIRLGNSSRRAGGLAEAFDERAPLGFKYPRIIVTDDYLYGSKVITSGRHRIEFSR